MLFDEMPMKLLRARVGSIGYTIYCYFMEKINRVINDVFRMNEDIILLTMSDLQIGREVFDKTLTSMFDLNIFDKEAYESEKILTNEDSQDNKLLVIEARAKTKERVKKYRESKECNALQLNKYNENVLNEDNIREEKNREDEKRLDELSIDNINVDFETINLEVDDELMETKGDLFKYVSSVFSIQDFGDFHKKIINDLYKRNPEKLALAITRCKHLGATKNINSLFASFNANKKESESLWEE